MNPLVFLLDAAGFHWFDGFVSNLVSAVKRKKSGTVGSRCQGKRKKKKAPTSRPMLDNIIIALFLTSDAASEVSLIRKARART